MTPVDDRTAAATEAARPEEPLVCKVCGVGQNTSPAERQNLQVCLWCGHLQPSSEQKAS